MLYNDSLITLLIFSLLALTGCGGGGESSSTPDSSDNPANSNQYTVPVTVTVLRSTDSVPLIDASVSISVTGSIGSYGSDDCTTDSDGECALSVSMFSSQDQTDSATVNIFTSLSGFSSNSASVETFAYNIGWNPVRKRYEYMSSDVTRTLYLMPL